MPDFTSAFLQGAQAGEARRRSQQQHETDLEELDLRKKMLKHSMDQLEITKQVREREQVRQDQAAQLALRDQAIQEGGIPQPGVMGPSPDQAGRPESAIPGPPAPDVAALTRQVALPAAGSFPAGFMSFPTIEGRDKNVLDAFNQQETLKRTLPPTRDQVIDNERLKQGAEDARLQRIQSNRIALTNAQSAESIRQLTYEIQKERLQLDKEKAQTAKDEAARSNNPAAIRTVTEAVLNRNLDYNQLDRYQRANVDAMLAATGMAIPRTLTGTEKANQAKADSGFQSTEIVADILAKNPQALLMVEVPGLGRLSPDAQALKLHRAEMSDVKSRLRTGAAQNDYETVFYGKQIPSAGDYLNPQIIQTKLNHFRGLYLAETGRPILLTAPDGKETLVISDGFNSNQRSVLRKKINEGWVPSPYQLILPANLGQAAAPGTSAPQGDADPLGILK